MKKNFLFPLFVFLLVLPGCMPGGYYSSTPHRELRNNPYYSYPPGPRGVTPEESYRWAQAQRAWARSEQEWARAEAARAAAAREWYRTDRDRNVWSRQNDFISREIDYIFRDTARTLGSETRREIRRGIRDIFH